jgi:hypothetical protein
MTHEVFAEARHNTEEISFSRAELDAVMLAYTPEALLSLLERDFEQEFSSSVGVSEGYTLRQHTEMALSQYERYFAHRDLPAGVSHNLMRFMLAVHDIGKPKAVISGDSQHATTRAIVEPVLKKLEFGDNTQRIILALLKDDYLGRSLKYDVDTSNEILAGAAEAGMSAEDFFDLVTVYYQVDAGSYTEDAGGIRSLDRLFVFNHEKGEVSFAPQTEARVAALRQQVQHAARKQQMQGAPAEQVVDKKTVRTFSRERSSKEREQLAAELWERRRYFFDQLQRRKELIAVLAEQAKRKELEAREVASRIEEIEGITRERKDSLVASLLHYFDTQALIQEKENLEKYYEDLAAGALRFQALKDEVAAEKIDRAALSAVRQELDAFYGIQEAAWIEYQEAEKARDIKNIAGQYDVFFVHGLKDKMAPDTNSLLSQSATVEDKLKILLAFEPTISTSTISAGDSNRNMWSRVGVLLAGGRVLEAMEGDAGTVARGLKQRENHQSTPDTEIAARIKSSIEKRAAWGTSYNELVVESPAVAGIYICIDADSTRIEYEPFRVERLLTISQETGLPLYAIEGGRVYEMTYEIDPESTKDRRDPSFGYVIKASPRHKIVLGKAITPAAVTEKAFSLTDGHRATIENEILEHSPFRLFGPEAERVQQRASGQEMYIDLFADRVRRVTTKEIVTYDGEPVDGLRPGEPVELITEMRHPNGSWLKVLRSAGTVFEQRYQAPLSITRKGEQQTRPLLPRDERSWVSQSNYYIHLSGGGYDLGRPAQQETFLEDVFRQVDYCKQRIAEFEAEAKEKGYGYRRGTIDSYQEAISDIAFYLYGFGEQAEKVGDLPVRDQAWSLAGRVLPLEQIKDVIGRRINSRGGFRVTKEDLA